MVLTYYKQRNWNKYLLDESLILLENLLHSTGTNYSLGVLQCVFLATVNTQIPAVSFVYMPGSDYLKSFCSTQYPEYVIQDIVWWSETCNTPG